MGVKIQEQQIFTAKDIKETIFACINDIHYNPLTKAEKLAKIIEKLLEIGPKIVLINGDILADSMFYDEQIIDFIKEITKYFPVVMTLGNKELMTGNNAKDTKIKDLEWVKHINYEFLNKLATIPNVTLMGNIEGIGIFKNNCYLEKENINIIGPNLGYEHYETAKEQLENMKNTLNCMRIAYKDGACNIVQMHTGYNITDYHHIYEFNLFKDYEIDGLIIGHTHNAWVPYLAEPIYTAGMFTPFLIMSIKKYGYKDGLKHTLKYIRTLGFKGVHGEMFPIASRGSFAIDDTNIIVCKPITALAETLGTKATIANSSFVLPPHITKVHVRQFKKED